MTKEEAIEHAKALIQFCSEDMGVRCGECPFGKPSQLTDRVICTITDYEDPPCGWELEEEE